MEKVHLTELLFADNMVILFEMEKKLQHNRNTLNKELKNMTVKFNVSKRKTLINASKDKKHYISRNEE